MSAVPNPPTLAPDGIDMAQPHASFGPLRPLHHEDLAAMQELILSSPRRRASLSAKLLFRTMDVVYGKARTLEKFRVLELVARVPYQAWENVAYVAMTHSTRNPGFARRIFERVRTARAEQDNEQWHLLTMEELTAGQQRPWFRTRVVPQLLAFGYYQLSWFLYALRPAWSYRLNADFEDHAQHEYALLVTDNPSFDTTLHHSTFEDHTGDVQTRTLGDLFRQIAYDERLHMLESERLIERSRFH